MASGTPVSFYRDLDLIAGSATVAGLGDAELLSRFALRRDATAEAAFEALVARHGPMVLATCRRSLRDAADADDAFQAAFLVLARKAGSVRVAGSLGPWLHAVARRVAIKAEAVSRKRRGGEGG
jgi:HlyD family secretion protein